MSDDTNNELVLIKFKCYSCAVENKFLVNDEITKCKRCGKVHFEIERIGGFLYVLSNKSIPNMYKIGFTRNIVQRRVEELNSTTSIPTDFDIELVFSCQEPYNAEVFVHQSLDNFRYNERREFFTTTLKRIYSIIQSYEDADLYFMKAQISDLHIYNPWNLELTSTENMNIHTPVSSFRCGKCGLQPRTFHKDMHYNASFYCKKCKLNYNSDYNLI